MGGEVGVVDVTTLGAEFVDVDGTTLGYGTSYGRAVEYLHFPHIFQRSVIELTWLLEVSSGASVIAHVSMDMACMMRYFGVREDSFR